MTAPPTRTDRRRARTRGALIAAAQQLLAEGRVEVSIQEITDRADVGFGSFYNHFADKPELWAAAVSETLAAHGDLVFALTAGIEDAAEVFCVGLRLTGRLQRVFPELARVLLHAGMNRLMSQEGLALAAFRDIEAGIAAGRFDVPDAPLALAMTAGSLLGLLYRLDADPAADAAVLADEMAFRTLLSVGVRRADARRLVSRPLPELPVAALG